MSIDGARRSEMDHNPGDKPRAECPEVELKIEIGMARRSVKLKMDGYKISEPD